MWLIRAIQTIKWIQKAKWDRLVRESPNSPICPTNYYNKSNKFNLSHWIPDCQPWRTRRLKYWITRLSLQSFSKHRWVVSIRWSVRIRNWARGLRRTKKRRRTRTLALRVLSGSISLWMRRRNPLRLWEVLRALHLRNTKILYWQTSICLRLWSRRLSVKYLRKLINSKIIKIIYLCNGRITWKESLDYKKWRIKMMDTSK